MDKKEMLKSMMSLKSKLMATVSMLLVSAILLTNVSYAWFVLSTAPEVSGVSTTSGANGALEIALQSNATSEAGTVTRAEVTTGVATSSALSTVAVTDANKFWGNIVDVTTGYGLEGLTLYPARLNITQQTVSTNGYLSVPQYGTDGRISGMRTTGTSHFVESSNTFEFGTNYGVNVHGFENTMGNEETVTSSYSREKVRQEAANRILESRESLRSRMAKMISQDSVGLVSLMLKVQDTEALFGPWTQEEIDSLGRIIAQSASVVSDATDALRWALLACVVSDTENYSPDDPDEMIELGAIYSSFLTMPLSSDAEGAVSVLSIAEDPEHNYSELANAIRSLETTQDAVALAQDDYGKGSYGFAGQKLVSHTSTFVMCGGDRPVSVVPGIGDYVSAVLASEQPPMEDGLVLVQDYVYFTGGLSDNPGLFPAMAVLLGDYSAEILAFMADDYSLSAIKVQDVSLLKFSYQVRATISNDVAGYNENENTGALQAAYEAAEAYADQAEGHIPVTTKRSDVTAYGYSIDFALRASESGNLILQDEPVSRVSNGYDDPQNINQNLQGSGSTMSFKIYEDMDVAQVEKLLESLYIVFMDSKSGSVYAIAVADEVSAELENVTASLKLHSPAYNIIDENTGLMVIGLAEEKQYIVNMMADIPVYLTAVVFLNGDTMSGSETGVGGLSLIGSINLQFALDGVKLEAMRYDDYYVAPPESQPAGN